MNEFPYNTQKTSQSDATIETIARRLSNLEAHIINLIVPIQGINEVFKNHGHLKALLDVIQKPLKIDTDSLQKLLRDFRQCMEDFREELKMLELGQTFSEIKYIGKRLLEIQSQIDEIKTTGIKSNMKVDVRLDGYEMVKKPIIFDKMDEEQPVKDQTYYINALLATLTEQEGKVLFNRAGLSGDKPKILAEISRLLGITPARCSQLLQKALKKCRTFERTKMVKKIGNDNLTKWVCGQEYLQ